MARQARWIRELPVGACSRQVVCHLVAHYTHRREGKVCLLTAPDRTETHTRLHRARTRLEMTDYFTLTTVTSRIKA